MTSQRILRILVIGAAVACMAALSNWMQTGEPPAAWLQTTCVLLFIAAMFTALIDQGSRPRLALRFVAALFALIAVIAFAADWTATGADGTQASRALLDHLTTFAPKLVTSLRSVVVNALGTNAWDPVLVTILDVPAWMAFAALSLFAGIAGRPRRQVQIFVN